MKSEMFFWKSSFFFFKDPTHVIQNSQFLDCHVFWIQKLTQYRIKMAFGYIFDGLFWLPFFPSQKLSLSLLVSPPFLFFSLFTDLLLFPFPPFLSTPLPRVFIGGGGKGHLTPIMAQGKVSWGVARRAWLPWLFSSLWRGGRACVGMGRCLVSWASRVERGRSKTQGKAAPSSPVLCVSRGRRRLMVPFKTTPFAYSFFF